MCRGRGLQRMGWKGITSMQRGCIRWCWLVWGWGSIFIKDDGRQTTDDGHEDALVFLIQRAVFGHNWSFLVEKGHLGRFWSFWVEKCRLGRFELNASTG